MSRAPKIPDYEYVAYVDESGDPGLKRVKPIDSRGSSEWQKYLGSAEKRAIELEDSYHIITVDGEKERVVGEVAEFVKRFTIAPQKRAAG